MTVIGISKITSKGQITLPISVRRLLKLDKGQNLAFCLDKSGIILSRLKLSVDSAPFTKEEWAKIEQLTLEKGKAYSNPEDAKRHLKEL
jgi:AbrB family looped-hinge helix DNA binding protein